MKLSFEQIKEITCGAVRTEYENGAVRFYRFTKEQEELYKITNEDFYYKALSTAGIKLVFKTNSKNLILKVTDLFCVSRSYFSFDIFVNGSPIGYIDNFSDKPVPENYTETDFPIANFSKSFELGEGEKTVCIYLPWSAKFGLNELSLDDGAYVAPVKPQKKLLAFGDSITQGYDALRPSMRYLSKLTDSLNAEEHNKAIGGEIFFPKLAELAEDFVPDYITVAYGTNDWNRKDEETFKTNCRAFYKNLSKNYKESKIFAITPIWRKDMNEFRQFGDFKKVEEDIAELVKDLENVTVISGFDFVPKNEKLFADGMLHPNDNGFDFYYKNLFDQIKKYI